MRPDQVKLIAKRLGVTERDVIDMNRRQRRRLANADPRRRRFGEWMDWLVDDGASQESPRRFGRPRTGTRPWARR
jgi:RNA polymerase sigma-32 factor